MRASTIAWIVVIILLLLGVLLWATSQAPNATPPQTQTSTATSTATSSESSAPTAPAQNIVLLVASSTKLGTFLTASNGMTLYAYAKDSVGTTTCYSACAANWPPYTTASAAGLSASPDATGAVSVIQRADGTLQITYNDVPLYFYIKDSVVGDTKGQNVGKVWKVVNP